MDNNINNENMNNVNNNLNINTPINEKKESPYIGIKDPLIRAQYEKEFNKPDYAMINGLIIIFICSIAFLFILSGDFFSDSKITKTKELSNDNLKENVNFIEEEPKIDIDSIDVNSLIVTDTTNTLMSDLVIDASYKIENLNYINSSFKVPYINIKSDDALKVNNEIKENYKQWAKESAKYKSSYGNTTLDISSLIKTSYEKLEYDNILSVVISYGKRENSIETYTYYAYVFNLTNDSLLIASTDEAINEIKNDNTVSSNDNYGKRLTYQEILSKLNLSYELIDMKYKEILTSYSGEYGNIDTINDTLNLYNDEVTNGTLSAFIDNNGNLNIISKIYNPLYENGTYRIFKYDGEKFESITSLAQLHNNQVIAQ